MKNIKEIIKEEQDYFHEHYYLDGVTFAGARHWTDGAKKGHINAYISNLAYDIAKTIIKETNGKTLAETLKKQKEFLK